MQSEARSRQRTGLGPVVPAEGREQPGLLLGVQPGAIYKGDTRGGSRYSLDLRALVTQPAERAAGAPAADYSEPQTEIALFEHDTGIAVTLVNFAVSPAGEGAGPGGAVAGPANPCSPFSMP